MIVVGIPTYNEADNISRLTKKIDQFADGMELSIIIVNADSVSTDDTTNVFLNTPTKSKKISIQNKSKGKGRNIHAILRYVADHRDAAGCVLIDGDITSFDESWFAKQAAMLHEGHDYVVPTYARNYQEGNTTNHFAYPLLGMHFNGIAPRQPIAGDFGLSAHFVKYMMQQRWHSYTNGYGIDIFLTLHALCGGFRVTEISLGKKLHKPSFGKMIPMFREVAASYYETARELFGNEAIANITLNQVDAPKLIQVQPLSDEVIAERKREAIELYGRATSLMTATTLNLPTRVTKELWVDVLITHERMTGRADSRSIAESILPWYLMRVITYLEDNHNAEKATDEIQRQFDLAMRQWNHEATHH